MVKIPYTKDFKNKMITTEFYNGQGLGNQLWCYFVTRCIALKNNYSFGIQSPQKFKGKEFLDIDMGIPVVGGEGPEGGPPTSLPNGIKYYYKEKEIFHPKTKAYISKKDEKLFEIQNNTKIDGVMQSIHYINSYRENIKSWFKIKSNFNDTSSKKDDICIIHIRGGDFLGSTAFLQKDYYDKAIEKMLLKNKNMNFYVITDDINYAKYVCPNYNVIGSAVSGKTDTHKASHHIGGPIWIDWTLLYNSKNAIISASSFSYWPIWLNDEVDVIAPMYWGDYKRSDGYWSGGDSLIPKWTYLHRNGNFYSYENCLKQKNNYEETHLKDYWK